MEESHRRGFSVVVSPKDGVFNARLYCVGDYRRDCEASGSSPLAAIESALKRAGPLHRYRAGAQVTSSGCKGDGEPGQPGTGLDGTRS